MLRRFSAAILIVALLGGATDLLHAHATDVCELLPAPHDAEAHRWRSESRPQNPDGDHCYLCHWQRSLRLAPSLSGRLVADSHSSDHVRPGAVFSIERQESSRLPARAPPRA